MTDSELLTELLERAAERTNVGPPPLEHMVAGARRKRRRRAMLLTAATAAAVVAAVGVTAVLSTPGGNPERDPTPATSASPEPSTSAEPTTRIDLEGTWTVRALVGANGESVLPDSARGRVRLTFADGEMTGSTGCNSVFGTYEQGGDEGQDLRFPREQLGSTLVGCGDEPPLVSRLLDVRHVSGSTGVRYLHAENWMIVAELRR
jgi:heat shock protein HslJ